jgi:antitoxin (DNA-binding transcriptional repressor) of toxin-antitoxin stability system
MKTASVADLRNNFRRVSAWLENGETVEIVKRGQVIAQLVPAGRKPRKVAKPNILGRLDEQWGSRTFSLEEVRAMRSAELEGEEG